MPTVLIILAIIWIIVPIIAKANKQKAKAAQEAQRAAQQRAAVQRAQETFPQRAQQPLRTAPLTPSIRPAQMATPSFEGLGSQEGQAGAILQGEQPHEVAASLSEVKSGLTEAKTSITHTVTVSSESGHAHEETSASGIEEACPPEKETKPAQTSVVPFEGAFAWSAENARSGLVMAEILGPCLALRD